MLGHGPNQPGQVVVGSKIIIEGTQNVSATSLMTINVMVDFLGIRKCPGLNIFLMFYSSNN